MHRALCACWSASPPSLFQQVPSGFVPAQDKQYLVGFAQLPDGASLDRTEEVIRKMSDIALTQPGVESSVAFPGLSINGFTNSLQRRHRVLDAEAVRRAQGSGARAAMRSRPTLNKKFAGIQEAFIAMFPPPPVQRPRHHRRLQAADRGPRRSRL